MTVKTRNEVKVSLCPDIPKTATTLQNQWNWIKNKKVLSAL